jgi:hypothetical protein
MKSNDIFDFKRVKECLIGTQRSQLLIVRTVIRTKLSLLVLKVPLINIT